MKKKLFNKINAILVTLIVISFSFHVYNRNNHFQEVDSTMIYQTTKDFMSMAMSRFNGTFLDGSDHNKILTKEFVTTIIDKPQISSLLNNIFQGAYTPETKEKIIDSLEKISFLWYLKMWLSFVAYKFSYVLPWISDGLKVAFTSTNSFWPSVVYGVVSYWVTDYDSFMSRILIVTLLVFHLSALLLYLILLKLKIRSPVALLTTLMMLFSISFYSYGYHQGSTIWNILTMMLFLYYIICNNENQRFYKNISKLVAVLVFFNYLIIFPWFALMLYKLYISVSKKNIEKYAWSRPKKWIISILKNIRLITKEQKVALIFISVCWLLFYEPTATQYLVLARKSAQWFWQVFINLYYIVLNFISVYAGNKRIDIWTFAVAIGLISSWYVCIFRNQIKYSRRVNLFLKIFVWMMLIIFSLRILVFIPSRHILWLAPLVFIPIAITIDRIADYIWKYKYVWSTCFVILFIGVWCFSVFDRSLKTLDIELKNQSPFIASYDETVILDVYWSKFWYTNKYGFLEKTSKIRHFLHPSDNFFSLVSLSAIERWKRYFYIGQMNDFSWRLQDRWIKNIKYKTYNEKKYWNNIYFIANNKWSWSPYGHTFPNVFYVWEFELLK